MLSTLGLGLASGVGLLSGHLCDVLCARLVMGDRIPEPEPVTVFDLTIGVRIRRP